MITGWYALARSGHPYYGPVPDGVEVLDGPPTVDTSTPPASVELGEQGVDTGEDSGTVPAEVPGDDLGTDLDEDVTGPADIDVTGENLDGDLERHEDKG